MGKRGTLMLSALVAALLAYVLIFERESLTSGELAARKGRALTSFVRDKVDRLEIQRRGVKVALTRGRLEGSEELGSWKLEAPAPGKADQDEVDRVLGELEWLDARRTIAIRGPEDTRAFGLDKPRYRVRYHAGRTTETLLIGHDEPRGEGVYAMLSGSEDALVVPKTLVEALDHPPSHYRDKELVDTVPLAWARKIELSGGNDSEQIEQREGRFVEAGGSAREPNLEMGALAPFADPQQMRQLLQRVDDLRATRFLEGAEEASAKATLASPARTVRVSVVPEEGREDKAPSRVEIVIGGACPGHDDERVVQVGGGPVVCARNQDLEPLLLPREALRQKRLIGEAPSEIEGITLETTGTKLSVRRDGENWKAEGQAAPDRDAVEAWLRDLATCEALAFAPVGPFATHTTVTLALGDGKKRVLAIGSPGLDGRVPVRRDQEGALVFYASELADRVTLHPQRFAPLALWNHQPSEVTKLTAQAGPYARSLVLSDGAFRLRAGEPPVADEGRVRDLIRDLVKLEALGFLTDQARPEYGVAAPRATAVFTLGADDKRIELRIGAASANGAYAVTAEGLVYEVGKEALSHIQELAGGPKPEPEAGSDSEDEDDHDHANEDAHSHEH